MKRFLYILILISLVGCQSAELIPTQTMIASTLTPLSTSTSTNSPSATPTLTLTITPSPTPKTCPSINADVVYKLPDAPFYHDEEIQALESFLNAGGDPNQLSAYYDVKFKGYFQANVIDLNADAVPDLFVREGDYFHSVLLFSCINGAYQEQLDEEERSNQIEIMGIDDFNKNDVPEIVYKEIGCFFSRCGSLSIIE